MPTSIAIRHLRTVGSLLGLEIDLDDAALHDAADDFSLVVDVAGAHPVAEAALLEGLAARDDAQPAGAHDQRYDVARLDEDRAVRARRRAATAEERRGRTVHAE